MTKEQIGHAVSVLPVQAGAVDELCLGCGVSKAWPQILAQVPAPAPAIQSRNHMARGLM